MSFDTIDNFRTGAVQFWIFCAAIVTVSGLLGVILVPAFPMIFIAFTAFGLGGCFTLVMTLPLDNTSSAEETDAWNGFIIMVGYVIGAAGPIATGIMRDISGNLGSALWMLTGCAVFMVTLAPALGPRKQTRGY